MARELRYKDLIEILAIKCHVSETTANKFMKNLMLIIASELQNNDHIKLDNIGVFSVEQKGGQDEWLMNELGVMRKTYVAPYQYINFEPSKNLLDVTNGKSINYLLKKSKKKYDEPIPFETLALENQDEDVMSKEIANTLNKKKSRKRKYRKKTYDANSTFAEYNKTRQRPILCKNNNVIYPSIYRASVDLDIAYTTLKEHTYGKICDMKYNGYEFEWVNDTDKQNNKTEREED